MRCTCFGVAVLAALALAGCQDRYGRVDPFRSTLLGAGVGAGALGIGSLIAQDQQYRRSYGHGGYGSGYGHGGGYGAGYGGGYRPYGGAYLPPVAAPSYGYGRGYGW